MKISAKILKHRGKNFSLAELPKEGLKFEPWEGLILEARMKGESIANFSGNDAILSCDEIIIKCSAFYGCEMPYTDLFAKILSEAMLNFFTRFGYGELTTAEIILAMEMNLSSDLKIPSEIENEKIEFSGKCVNVMFVSKVLKKYIYLRNMLDRKLQNIIDGY